jgi:hypothetical protein
VSSASASWRPVRFLFASPAPRAYLVCALEAGMLGLYSPMIASNNTFTTTNNTLVFGARPANSIDKFEQAIERLLQDQRQEEARAVVPDAEPATEH